PRTKKAVDVRHRWLRHAAFIQGPDEGATIVIWPEFNPVMGLDPLRQMRVCRWSSRLRGAPGVDGHLYTTVHRVGGRTLRGVPNVATDPTHLGLWFLAVLVGALAELLRG